MTYDSWRWGDESTQTRAQKRVNFIKAVPCFSDSALAGTRIFYAAVWMYLEMLKASDGFSFWLSRLKFFTHWSWYSWGAFLGTALYAHIRYQW